MNKKKEVFDKAKKRCECDGQCQLDGRGGRESQSAEYFAFNKKERTFMKEMKVLSTKVDLLKNAKNTGLLYWQRKIKDYTQWSCCLSEVTIQGKLVDVAKIVTAALTTVDGLLKALKGLVCMGMEVMGRSIGEYLDATYFAGLKAANEANPLCKDLGPEMPKSNVGKVGKLRSKGSSTSLQQSNKQGWKLVSGELAKKPKDANGNDADEPLEQQIAKEAGKMLVAFVSFKRPVFFQALVKFIIFAMMKTEIPELVDFLTKNKKAVDTLLYLINILWIAFCGKVFSALMSVLFDVVLCQMCTFGCACKIGKLVPPLIFNEKCKDPEFPSNGKCKKGWVISSSRKTCEKVMDDVPLETVVAKSDGDKGVIVYGNAPKGNCTAMCKKKGFDRANNKDPHPHMCCPATSADGLTRTKDKTTPATPVTCGACKCVSNKTVTPRSSWTVAYSGADGKFDIGKGMFDSAFEDCRVVRYTAANGGGPILLQRLKAMAPGESAYEMIMGRKRVVMGVSATQSSTFHPDSKAANALIIGSLVSKTRFETKPWLRIDLGEQRSVVSVRLVQATTGDANSQGGGLGGVQVAIGASHTNIGVRCGNDAAGKYAAGASGAAPVPDDRCKEGIELYRGKNYKLGPSTNGKVLHQRKRIKWSSNYGKGSLFGVGPGGTIDSTAMWKPSKRVNDRHAKPSTFRDLFNSPKSVLTRDAGNDVIFKAMPAISTKEENVALNKPTPTFSAGGAKSVARWVQLDVGKSAKNTKTMSCADCYSCQTLHSPTICAAIVTAGFRSKAEAGKMKDVDCRNTLIIEINKASKKKNLIKELQGKSSDALIQMILFSYTYSSREVIVKQTSSKGGWGQALKIKCMRRPAGNSVTVKPASRDDANGSRGTPVLTPAWTRIDLGAQHRITAVVIHSKDTSGLKNAEVWAGTGTDVKGTGFVFGGKRRANQLCDQWQRNEAIWTVTCVNNNARYVFIASPQAFELGKVEIQGSKYLPAFESQYGGRKVIIRPSDVNNVAGIFQSARTRWVGESTLKDLTTMPDDYYGCTAEYTKKRDGSTNPREVNDLLNAQGVGGKHGNNGNLLFRGCAVKSIKIPDGCKVRLRQKHKNFGWLAVDLTKSVPDLGQLNFGFKISSSGKGDAAALGNRATGAKGRETGKCSKKDVVLPNAPGVGGWGGLCTCPNGKEYWVGDIQGSACGSLACVGGKAGKCNKQTRAKWSRKKVTCGRSAIKKEFHGNCPPDVLKTYGFSRQKCGKKTDGNGRVLDEAECKYMNWGPNWNDLTDSPLTANGGGTLVGGRIQRLQYG